MSTSSTRTAEPEASAPAETIAPNFQLTPPEAIEPLAGQAANAAVPLAPDLRDAVDTQVESFIQNLLTEDLEGEAFRARLDSAFALGREEISIAASLMQGRFMQRNFVGMENSPAFKAIQDMRGHLDALNPGHDGDLLQAQKLLGFIPFGNRLQTYFRKFETAGAHVQQSLQQLYTARDDMQRDVLEIEATRTKLWEAMQKLGAAARFAETLDTKLAARMDALMASDPPRAQALQQEVLFYVRQNLSDILTQQAVCTNGYLTLDVLKKTGREMMNGCSRVATTGMSALVVAQTVARATGNQIRVMDMLKGVNSSIENLIAEGGRQLNSHVERTAQFAENPMIGIERIKDMFDQTFKAMDAMDRFRGKALEVMSQNNRVMAEQLQRADTYLDRLRQEKARDSARLSLSGPVAL